jgi:hypothetical protein
MFKNDQIIYYIDGDFDIQKGIYKGYVRITSSCPLDIINIYDSHLNEHVLIVEDYVFNSHEEAEEFLNEDENKY